MAVPQYMVSLHWLILWTLVGAAFLLLLSRPPGDLLPFGTLLDPIDGLYYTARSAGHPQDAEVSLDGLEGDVEIIRDARGVPHIFATSDLDAITALGYVVAQDRLFQIDFLARVAAGRLSDVLGLAALDTDRFMRTIGMEWAAQRNAERVLEEDDLERELLDAYARGINTYIDQLDERDLPFEMRLLGYWPDYFDAHQAFRVNQFMSFDLTFGVEPADEYHTVREALGDDVFDELYPVHSRLYVPIVPEEGGVVEDPEERSLFRPAAELLRDARQILQASTERRRSFFGTLGEGYLDSKGSNNWAVMGERSETGAPLFAGDPHLRLSLPSIWYQAHLVTPNMNVYGVTIPGTVTPIMGYNDYVGWSSTNTGADVVDHYLLELNQDRTAYRYEEGYRDLEIVPDTIFVRGQEPVVDTLWYSHWGPVLHDDERVEGLGAVAIQWTAHRENRTLEALWRMNQARSVEEFDEALRSWDTPMQNWLAADVHGNISIRAAGYLPIRNAGHGIGMLDGSSDEFSWTGRVPFEELPHSFNPEQGYLASANQQPTDPTYEHYLGYNWRDSFRSVRLDSLLRGTEQHGIEDFMRYQADIVAMQHPLFVPMLDTLPDLSPRADTLRRMLVAWNGQTSVDRPEPLILDEWLSILEQTVWDDPAFVEGIRPTLSTLHHLLENEPRAQWFVLDEESYNLVEGSASHVLRYTIEATADTLESKYGWDPDEWTWGDHHQVIFQHLTRADALAPLNRGPYPYPGFFETLSPARGREVVHSASWRSIYDFSEQPVVGYGVHPGGQSGNPFSPFYDDYLPTFLDFDYYELLKPDTPDELDADQISSRLILRSSP